jgi:predicted Zn-dependent peptidase
MLAHSIEEVRLKNGAKGLLIDIPGASVMSFRINFRAGDIYTASSDKWETAHIMEHLSLGANKKFKSAREYQADLEKNGAYSNASTGQTDMTYEAECADFEWDTFFELFVLGISKPLFLESEFKAECGNVHEELVGRGNNHSSRLGLEMAKAYGLNMKTFQERVELMGNVTIEDIKEHYNKTHFTENMRFIVAGSMKGRKSKLKATLEAMTLPKSNITHRFEIPVEQPKGFESSLFVENKSVPNAYFYIDTYSLGELELDEMYALSLLGTVLTDTYYSKILGEAREKGLIYYLSSNYYRTKGHSSWWFGSQISEKQLAPFLEIFVREIDKAKKGKIADTDIAAAKMNQLGGFQRDAQTVNALVNGYGGMYFYNEMVNDYYTNFSNKLKRITAEDMTVMANKMFADNVWGLGFLGTISEKARSDAHAQISSLWRD